MKLMVTLRRSGAVHHLVLETPAGVTRGEAGRRLGLPPSATGSPQEAGQPLLHGADLGLPTASTASSRGDPRDAAVPWVVVAEGPDAGSAVPLRPGRWVTIGRGPLCDIQIQDPALSRRHVRLRLERKAVRVEDLRSTNGIEWELGGTGDTWRPDDRLLLGGSAVVLLPRAPAPRTTTAQDGHLEVTPWPVRETSPEEIVLARPRPPDRRIVRRPSAWTWALPLAVALLVALVLRMPWLLLFGLLGPAMVFGHHLADRRAAREEFEEATTACTQGARAVEAAAQHACRHDLLLRRERDPGIAGAVLSLVPHISTPLWDRSDRSPRVVLGQSPGPSGVRLDGELLGHARAPVVLDIGGPLAIAGPPAAREGLMRSVVLQLACRQAPGAIRLHVDLGDPPVGPWDLLAWLPHTSSLVGPGVVTLRWGHDLVLVDQIYEAPPGCTVVGLSVDGRGTLHRAGQPDVSFRPTLLSLGSARRLARLLAPARPATPRVGSGALGVPAEAGPLALGDVVGWPTGVDDVLHGWRDGRLGTALGLGAGGSPLEVDLLRDGPHALVAGTTGSGKSELLRTLVAGLALRRSPADLSLLLVDYKGGSSLADCAAFPQVTGLVTDLDPHLAQRVLVSLQAELTRRESVLHAAGARDIRDHTGGDLPRLVIVVDEFRVLAEEVPDVLAGLVRLAAVGRSLGVHLVLATQRPAGVVSADLRANVNLRVALRVRDAADSHDVLDCADAAALPEGRPGLALVRTGADAPRSVQVACLTSPRPTAAPDPVWRVHEHADVWAARRELEVRTPSDGPGESDAVAELAALLQAAADRMGATAPAVWCPPLADRILTSHEHPHAWAVIDHPAQQRQEHRGWSPVHHLGLVGSARSGRSTAVHSLLQRMDAAWFVVLDLGRGLDTTGLQDHPACCAWVGPDDLAHGLRVLDLLLAVVQSRQAHPGTATDPLVLVLDGWDRFVDLFGEVDRGRAVDLAVRILREGPAVRVVAVITGDRSLLVGRLAALLPETWALPVNDPSDLMLTGLRPSQLPRERPPGRVVGVRDGLLGQVVLPDPGRSPGTPSSTGRPLRCLALPRSWAGSAHATGAVPPFALGGDEAELVSAPAGGLLVLGPPGSGRSWTLQVVIDSRPGAGLRVDGTTPPDDDELRELLSHLPPEGCLFVDDGHLLAGTSTEDLLLDHAARHRTDVVVTADLDAAVSTFRGLVPHVGRSRTAIVLQPSTPAQGAVVGVSLPVGDLRVPGRGVLVSRGRCTRIQVVSPAGPDAAPGPASAGPCISSVSSQPAGP